MALRYDSMRLGDQPLIMLAATHLQELEQDVSLAQAPRMERGLRVPHRRRLPATALHALGGRVRSLYRRR